MAAKLNISESIILRIAVTLATLLVVLRHGFNLHRFYPDGLQGMRICDVNVFCQCCLSEFTALAIPAFFFISGLLFFLNVNSTADILLKWKRRLKSLLLPFLSWNLLFLIIIIVLAAIPACNRQLVSTYSFSLKWQWILTRMSVKPIVGQFWYIRTLMLFCMFTPACLCFYKNAIASLCMLFLLHFFWSPVDCGILSSEGAFWFYLGGLVGYKEWHSALFRLQRGWWGLVLIVSLNILLGVFHCRWSIISWNARIILSVYLLFQFSSFIATFPRLTSLLCRFGKHAFFVYALHAVLLSFPELLLAKLLPHNAWSSFFCYWGCIAATLAISIGFSYLLRRFAPRIAALLNGYR